MDTSTTSMRSQIGALKENGMRIGIIGSGNVGSALGRLAAAAGHHVRLGAREVTRREDALSVVSIAAAAEHGDLVVLALPYAACHQALPPLASRLRGKIVVDATNPLLPDWSPLLLGEHTSGAQEIARSLPGSRVVKAFNTVFADTMSREGLKRGEGRAVSAFIASDDADALVEVARFAGGLGFAPVVVGALAHARYLEAMANLNIAIAVGQGIGTRAAFVYDRGASA